MTVRPARLVRRKCGRRKDAAASDPQVATFLDSIAHEGRGIASVTVWEILDGIGRIDPGRRQRELADRFQDLLDDLFEGRFVAWPAADAQVCARIMEDQRRRGEMPGSHS